MDVALEGSDDLLLHHSRAGIAEHAHAELEAVVAPTFSVYQDFDVTGLAVSRYDTGNLEVGRRFACGFSGDLCDRPYGKTIFNHGTDRYMRSRQVRIPIRKEFTWTLRTQRLCFVTLRFLLRDAADTSRWIAARKRWP